MVCLKDPLVQKICHLYERISRLDNLKPSKDVDVLFTELVVTCIPPYPIDVTKLCDKIQEMRSNLIRLCGEAEGLMEKHFSTILGSFDSPLDHLEIFPYFSNYLKLSRLEYNILSQQCSDVPSRVAFLGSGPLPLTSIVLASYHMTSTTFHNYDIDSSANSMASHLVESHPDLSKRMVFHTTDVMSVTDAFKDYDVVFLAALVGMDKEEKVGVIEHLAKYMAPGSLLMLRSAHGARTFLYPAVEPCDLRGFEVLSMFHPTDDVINSVIVARKSPTLTLSKRSSDHQGFASGNLMISCKCAKVHQTFNSLSQIKMTQELAVEDHHF